MPTLQTDVEAFLEYIGANSPRTRRTYRAAIRHLLAYLQDVWKPGDEQLTAAKLTPEMLHRYPGWLARQTWQLTSHADPQLLAESTRALYLVAAGNLLTYLTKLKRLTHFDAADIEAVRDTFRRATAVKQAPIHQKVPPDDVVQALIAAARTDPSPPAEKTKSPPPATLRRKKLIQKRDLALLITLQRTGLRVSELVELRRKNLDLSRKGAWVSGKGRKTRFVPFHDAALAAIQTYLKLRQDGQLIAPLGDHPLFCRHDKRAQIDRRLPLTTRAVRDIIDKLSDRAHLSDRFHCTPHSLRHFFATRLLRKTGDLALVQDALGHSDPKTTRIYAQTSPEKLAKAVRGLD